MGGVDKVVEVVEETVETNVSEDAVTQCLKEIYELNTEMKTLWNKQLAKVKQMEKLLKKNQKLANKMKNKKSKPKREPSGFAKPTPISEELCTFLKKPLGTEMARTEVTKFLTNYIKENKRVIVPDSKLKKLLKVQKDDKVTYFNLQKF